jgi:hypothetical protein
MSTVAHVAHGHHSSQQVELARSEAEKKDLQTGFSSREFELLHCRFAVLHLGQTRVETSTIISTVYCEESSRCCRVFGSLVVCA